ncbi:MAG: hypothetical protein Q8K35_07330 [Thiobacillus sp.]|nr:hypothetical protein [Thiobacillus sp.]MDP2057556.1 hypothetical protein [Thiobacillus sp.]
MNKKLAHLAERRSQLVAQSAAQRTVLAHNLEPWRARLALAPTRGWPCFVLLGATLP